MRSSGLWGMPINDDDDDWGLDEFGYRRERANQSVVINCIKCSQKNTEFGIAKIRHFVKFHRVN